MSKLTKSDLKVRVSVVHSYPSVLSGIDVCLPPGATIYKSSDGKVGLELAMKREPQVVIVGWDFQGGNSVELIRSFRSCLRCAPQVIVYSSYVTPSMCALALSAGAFDVVLFSDPPEVLQEAIDCAVGGRGPRDESPVRKLRSVFELDGRLEFEGGYLTAKEHQVLKHVALGLSNLEISGELGIKGNTAKEHVREVLRKLKVRDRTAAATWALREGVVE